MNATEKTDILNRFKALIRNRLVANHKRNTEKLVDIKEFQINPFLLHYLANYLEGSATTESLAKVLVYPRVLGTSITTSFGTMMQRFVSEVLSAYGSTTSGIDIEFIDCIDNRKKYCQLKSGPNAINRDDVTTVKNHFRDARNLARQNNVPTHPNDFIFCMIYGREEEKNSFVREVEADYTVLIGKDFWHHFTGDENFYQELIHAVGEIANEIDMKRIVENVISELSAKIEDRLSELAE